MSGWVDPGLPDFSHLGELYRQRPTVDNADLLPPVTSSDAITDTINYMETLNAIFTQVHESAIAQLPKEISTRAEFIAFLGDAKHAVEDKFGTEVGTEFEVDDIELDEGLLVFRFVIQLNEDIHSAMTKLHQLDEWRSQQTSASSDLIYFDLDV
jgi:hypothetical protein